MSIDSTPDLTHVDQLSMIIRYVSVTSHEATERFLSFIPIESHNGEYLANIILTFFVDQQIDIKNARRQLYDNAANMPGRYNGVQAKIIEKNPLSFYIPCTAHSLNLAGVCAAESCLEATRFFVQQLFSFFFWINSSLVSASKKHWPKKVSCQAPFGH